MIFASLAHAALPNPDLLRLPDRFEGRGVEVVPEPPPPSASDMGWDIQHYSLAVRIDPGARLVTGLATITANATTGGDFVLDVAGPVVSAVRVNGVDTDVEVVDEELHIPGITGDSVTVEVEWTATGGLAAGIQWGAVVYSFHEPSGARMWLPVYDHPWDKATLDWYITAPDAWVVAANGVLAETAADAGWTTWHYAFDQPIPTYLMTVHMADYVVSVEGSDIPVYSWAYRGQEDAAADAFAQTADMLDYFSGLYGPYAFPSYGNAMAPFPGGMENTTCVTFSEDAVAGGRGELLNAHELGHHWWGDDVTVATWDDIWLNEGFATYTEVLWYEHAFGQQGLTAYVASLADDYYEWRELEGIGPLYDPVYMWGGTVYDKGALVLHMLRSVLGEDRFFDALRAYEESYHLGNATTADFEAAVEASSGEDLGWFFDEWVYGSGEPTYTWGWAAQGGGDAWQLDVSIAQDAPEYAMPVPVRVTYADGSSEEKVVSVSGDQTNASFCLDARPVSVELDPDLWVLRAGEEEVDVSEGAVVCWEEEEGKGCGCGTGAAPGVVGVMLGLALVRRRPALPPPVRGGRAGEGGPR